MSIRPKGIQWLATEHGVTDGIIKVSKFYVPKESWTKKAAWAVELDASKVDMAPSETLHLVLEKTPGENAFHYLKVPSNYLIENQAKLYVIQSKNRFSMFLSAEQDNLFQDERGEGKVSFSQFTA